MKIHCEVAPVLGQIFKSNIHSVEQQPEENDNLNKVDELENYLSRKSSVKGLHKNLVNQQPNGQMHLQIGTKVSYSTSQQYDYTNCYYSYILLQLLLHF